MRVSKNYYFCGLIFVIFGLFFSNCSVKDAKKGKLNQNVLASEIKQEVEYVDIDTRLRELKRPSDSEIQALGDSLYKTDGDRVIGDICFHMNKKDYKKAYNSLMEEFDGHLYIMCSNLPDYFFFIDSIIPSFHDGKLWSVSFYGLMDNSANSRQMNTQIKNSFDHLKEMFLRKYGPPYYVVYDMDYPATNAVYPIKSIEWRFSHRSISIMPRGGEMKIGGQTILEPHPNVFRIYDTETQQIVNEESKKQWEKIKTKLGKELERIENAKERKKKIQQTL